MSSSVDDNVCNLNFIDLEKNNTAEPAAVPNLEIKEIPNSNIS